MVHCTSGENAMGCLPRFVAWGNCPIAREFPQKKTFRRSGAMGHFKPPPAGIPVGQCRQCLRGKQGAQGLRRNITRLYILKKEMIFRYWTHSLPCMDISTKSPLRERLNAGQVSMQANEMDKAKIHNATKARPTEMLHAQMIGATLAPRIADGHSHVSFVRWTFGLMNRLVRVSDLVMILAGAVLSATVLPDAYANPLPALQLLLIVLTQALIFQAAMQRMQAYRLERYTDMLVASLHVIGGLAPAMLVTLVVLSAFVPNAADRLDYLAAWAALVVLLLLISRQVQALLLGSAARNRLLHRRVVVIGANPAAEQVIQDLSTFRQGETYEVAGIFRAGPDENGIPGIGDIPVLGSLEDLSHFAQDNTIDVLVIALPWARSGEIFQLVDSLSWIAADIVVPFEGKAVNLEFARVMQLGTRPTLQVLSRPLKGSQGVLKVIEDYVVAATALLLLSPIMLLAALAIRLDSPGPVLFRQTRPGFGNRPFDIIKFRTMHVDPTDDATIGTTGPNDKRVTRVGAVLRRLSLDELPQLFNVLRGEMSIVGPRPYVANMLVGNERFSDLVRQYAERHRIKPGITGYAQAHGLRSFALRDKKFARQSIEMDLHYMRHWSLWLDFKIMIRTVATGLIGRDVF